MDYKGIEKLWMTQRKIPKADKLVVNYKTQTALELIIDKTKKMAKEKKSEDYEQFVQQAIKSELKQYEDAQSQGVDCLVEINLLKEMMPKKLGEEEISGMVIAIIARYEKPNMGQVMGELKKIENMDMQIASRYVKELL